MCCAHIYIYATYPLVESAREVSRSNPRQRAMHRAAHSPHFLVARERERLLLANPHHSRIGALLALSLGSIITVRIHFALVPRKRLISRGMPISVFLFPHPLCICAIYTHTLTCVCVLRNIEIFASFPYLFFFVLSLRIEERKRRGT